MSVEKIKLTSLVDGGGCAAKLKATELISILKTLPKTECKNLEVGFDGNEDALVYNINKEQSLLSTVDFFPPMVDDPFTFGEVAAANAISDIYAMGGRPLYALSLMCFPQKLDKSILKEILLGGISKAKEALIPIAGGHTIDDKIIKYGLCVVGVCEKGKAWRNNGVKVGDSLVLTKSLGVGIINTAVKCNEASKKAEQKAIESMITLNKEASEKAKKYQIHAATDITGFGLLGHLMEMMNGSNLTALIDSKNVPYIDEAYSLAEYGLLPCGLYNNKEYTEGKVVFSKEIPQSISDIMYSPETSGGLLLSMSKKDALSYVKDYRVAKIIGEVSKKSNALISVI